MHMPEMVAKQAPDLLKAMEQRRLDVGASQTEWGRRLGISQGHYSKVIRGSTSPGRKLLASMGALVEQPTLLEFEANLLAAARTTPRFNDLLQTLLDMHFDASGKRT